MGIKENVIALRAREVPELVAIDGGEERERKSRGSRGSELVKNGVGVSSGHIVGVIVGKLPESKRLVWESMVSEASPDFVGMARWLMKQQQEEAVFYVNGEVEIAPISSSLVQDWYSRERAGEIAKELFEGNRKYRGIDSLGAMEQLLADSMGDVSAIRARVFSPKSDVSDSELLKALPQIANVAVKGAIAVDTLRKGTDVKGAEIRGAIVMGNHIRNLFKGTQLEQFIDKEVMDVILEMESVQ